MGRPRLYSDEERRQKRRLKSAHWRAANREQSRKINRESMKRASDKAAVAAGRTPGRCGRPIIPRTIEEKRARQTARVMKWYRENQSTARMIGATAARNRRARIREVGGSHSTKDVCALRERQKDNCAFCLLPLGSRTHIDHYLPLALGGTNDIGNLRVLHPKCNLTKGALHPMQHAISNGMLCW